MGVVHHANYLVWFELAHTALCSESGVAYTEVEQLGYFLMVTGAELLYQRSATYGNTVSVDCWIDKLTSRGLCFAYVVRRGDERLVTGATRHVWVERASGRFCRTPEVLREPFAQLAGR